MQKDTHTHTHTQKQKQKYRLNSSKVLKQCHLVNLLF